MAGWATNVALHPGRVVGLLTACAVALAVTSKLRRVHGTVAYGICGAAAAWVSGFGMATMTRGLRDCFWSLPGRRGTVCMSWWGVHPATIMRGGVLVTGVACVAAASMLIRTRRGLASNVLTPIGLALVAWGLSSSFAAQRFEGWLSPLLAACAATAFRVAFWQHEHPQPPCTWLSRLARAMLGLGSTYLLLGMGEQLFAAPVIVPLAWFAARRSGATARWFFVVIASLYTGFAIGAAATVVLGGAGFMPVFGATFITGVVGFGGTTRPPAIETSRRPLAARR